MSKFIAIFLNLAFIVGCMPALSTGGFGGDESGLTDITISKFDQTALTNAFGANCEKVDLKLLTEKSKLTETGCALVDKVLNAFTLKLATTSTAPECVIPEAEKMVGKGLGETLNISLKKACNYDLELWVGFMQGTTGFSFYTGKKSVTSAELVAAPNSKLDIAIPLTLTTDGQAYGFGGVPTPVIPGPTPPPGPGPGPGPVVDTAAQVVQLNKILTSCGGCHASDEGGGVKVGGLDFRIHTAQKLIDGLASGTTLNILIEISNSVSGDAPTMPKGGAKLDPADVTFLKSLVEAK